MSINLLNGSIHYSIYLLLMGRNPCAKLILNHGAYPNIRDVLQTTALPIAAERDNIGAVKILLRYKTDLNIQDSDINTPLHIGTARII